MSRILQTYPPQFPLWEKLPFVITNVRSQTFVCATSELAYAITANTPQQNITVVFPVNFDLNQQTVIITTLLDPLVDYQGFAPFGVQSWIAGGNDNEALLQCFNLGNDDVNIKLSVMIF